MKCPCCEKDLLEFEKPKYSTCENEWCIANNLSAVWVEGTVQFPALPEGIRLEVAHILLETLLENQTT
jgi:hypothetical protein